MRPDLPEFPLFQWARRMPVCVTGGQVWMASSHDGRSGRVGLTWNRARYDLVNVQTLEDMWGDYISRHARTLEDWQLQHLRECGRQVALPGELKEKVRQMEILAFLSRRLIPRLQRLQGGAAASAPVSSEEVCEWKRQLEDHAAGEKQSLPTFALLCSAFPAADDGWGLIEMACYRLVRISPERMWWSAADLTLPQAAYTLDARLSGSAEIEARFYDRLKFLLRLRASGGRLGASSGGDRAEEIEAAFGRCSAWIEERGMDAEGRVLLYDQAEWRVFRQHGQWFVGLQVKPFALEDAGGALYGFDGPLITTRISMENPAYTVEVDSFGYDHPFLPAGGRTICMGGYHERVAPEAGSSPHDRAVARAPEEGLLQVLLDARQTLIAGWHAQNPIRPHRRLSDFGHRRITRQQAEARGLAVYPYYRRRP